MSLLRSLRLAGLCLAGSLSVSFITSATAQTSPTTVAGSLEGKFAVDDSGAATYSIPLSVPPGIAGNEPRLALSYSSQAGNGPLGVGWGLSGLSAITRCDQRLVPHGKIHSVDFSVEDRFCLDGQRIVAVSGDYGADGTEYRTEIESYAKVISNGTAGTGPESFTVWSKGGLVLEYGVTDDSRIEAIKADGTTRSEARLWALNKQSDRSDNAITYSYTEDQTNGSYRIDRIDYGGNTTAGTTATSSVRFVYENRADSRSSFQAGAKINQDKRLTNVQTFEAETLVSDYRLTYDSKVAGYPDDPSATALASCKAILDAGSSTGNGYYQIDPDGEGGAPAFEAYCNMTDNGGGWTLAASISSSNYNHFQAGSHDSNGNGRIDFEQIGEKLEDTVISSLYDDRLWVNIIGGSGDMHCEKVNQSGAGLNFAYNYSPTCGYTYASTQTYTGTGSNANWGIQVWKNYDYRAYRNNYAGCFGAAATYVPSGQGGCSYHPSRGGYLWVR